MKTSKKIALEIAAIAIILTIAITIIYFTPLKVNNQCHDEHIYRWKFGVYNLDTIDEKTYLAFRNIKNCYMIEKQEVNAYLIAVYHSVLIEKSVLEALTKEA